MTTFNDHQQRQEAEYQLPYHWFWSRDSELGRSYFSYLRMVVDRVPTDARTLIDVGCGDGKSTAFIADARPDVKVSGSDYSVQALELARVMSGSRTIEWKQGNLYEDMGKTLGIFDCVTAIEVLEHMPIDRLQDALRGIKALLAPQGILIVTVPSVLMEISDKHFQHFTAQTMTAALEQAGFIVKSVDGQDRSRHWFRLVYKFVDNRWWAIKPLMRWLNMEAYTRHVATCPKEAGNRLVFVATV